MKTERAMESAVMSDKVASHYADDSDLAGRIADSLRKAGKDIAKLSTTDLATVDEFHILAARRGRE
jgi:hypothetical protein